MLIAPTEFCGLGFWRLRNGTIVEVEKRLTLECKGPDGPFLYDVWAGHCQCCRSHFTWNLDGRFAAVGTHHHDIVGRAPDTVMWSKINDPTDWSA